MADAIFLSASVPDPQRSPEFAATADPVAIAAAVSALVHVTLGRRQLIWGGHPAITPMIWVVAESLGVDYASWVTLYQSLYFEDQFPEDNLRFKNINYTQSVDRDLAGSLRTMREEMFRSNLFSSAVFIGGMQGVLDEFTLFKLYQPKATIIPVVSTGGATLALAERISDLDSELNINLDYVGLFHRKLGISVRERRYERPETQPANIEERYLRPQPPTRSGPR